MARVHLQRIIQLSAAKVKETSCIGAFRARVLMKELIGNSSARAKLLLLGLELGMA